MVLKLTFTIDGIRGTDVQYKCSGRCRSDQKQSYEFVKT